MNLQLFENKSLCMKSPYTCAILLKAVRRERGRKTRKELKSKNERMELKLLSGTRLDLTSYFAILAGNANLVHELARAERMAVRLVFAKVKDKPTCL